MNPHEKTEAIILLTGILFFIAGIINRRKWLVLLRNGIKTEGVVFRIDKEYRFGKTIKSSYYPVIRYVTLEKEWVTKESDNQIFPGLYKEGDKVTVVYDRVNKSRFLIDNWSSRWGSLFFILIGIALIVFAVISLFHINSISI